MPKRKLLNSITYKFIDFFSLCVCVRVFCCFFLFQNVPPSFSVRFRVHRTIVNQHHFDFFVLTILAVCIRLCYISIPLIGSYPSHDTSKIGRVISSLMPSLCCAPSSMFTRWQHAVIIREIDEIAFSFIAFNDKNYFFLPLLLSIERMERSCCVPLDISRFNRFSTLLTECSM